MEELCEFLYKKKNELNPQFNLQVSDVTAMSDIFRIQCFVKI